MEKRREEKRREESRETKERERRGWGVGLEGDVRAHSVYTYRVSNAVNRRGSRDSLLVERRTRDRKGCEFESRQKRRENVLLKC